ncbi:GNAT family N-acetyltransferase [Wenjunlia tyrosinilytica]|uniref:N-acetyltransferase n=1 Tax=Wenjunlia tyrosinilytica TaxID=1544741 RepID=A0A918DYZ6_9ACTN|nr:GNAT family N-acetyltransferase [Wenjunlia tyrosinilytica]GGO92293.1 N-acetyltransferase [Wenjunlia tyrosinilytica]
MNAPNAPAVDVTTWFLEQTSPGDLSPSAAPGPESGTDILRAEIASPEFSRFLYTAVGGDHHWTDRLPWSHRQWEEWLGRAGSETWVLYVRGTPAGFVELDAQDGATVEIAYFGLLPSFTGRGLGGHLLSFGLARAWDLAERHTGRRVTTRVWVHTCSLDGPAALGNYERRGMRIYDARTRPETVGPTPGPWPGAR